MITLIHGDSQMHSRELLNQKIADYRLKNFDLIRLAGKDLKVEDLLQALESPALFAGRRLIVIEGLLSLRPSKLKDDLVKLVADHTEVEQLLWEPKSVTATAIKKLGQVMVKEFTTPKQVFKFLDSLAPKQAEKVLKLLHVAVANEAVELVFYLLHRRVSQLIQAKDGHGLKGAPWQIGKLKSQANSFTLAQLQSLHLALLAADFSLKSGADDLPLLGQLDLILIKL